MYDIRSGLILLVDCIDKRSLAGMTMMSETIFFALQVFELPPPPPHTLTLYVKSQSLLEIYYAKITLGKFKCIIWNI